MSFSNKRGNYEHSLRHIRLNFFHVRRQATNAFSSLGYRRPSAFAGGGREFGKIGGSQPRTRGERLRTKDRQDQFLPGEIDKKARWREVLDGEKIPLRNGYEICG